jgi:organic hydroperoxide reductase OsmC/OhrA
MAHGRTHSYAVTVTWTGNTGAGTSGYRAYSRDHVISAGAKPAIAGSSDPAFRGDPARWNPEDLFVGSLSACHKLWYLHLAATHGIVVVAYSDAATGTMTEDETGGGRFTDVVLRPQVTIAAGGDIALAERLHRDAHEKCFVANSVTCPVRVEPQVRTADPASHEP